MQSKSIQKCHYCKPIFFPLAHLLLMHLTAVALPWCSMTAVLLIL